MPSFATEAYTLRFIPMREDLSRTEILGDPEYPPRKAIEAPPPEPQPFANLPEEEAEVRQFLCDYAINSNLHLQVLEQFHQSKDEALGRSDLQLATGGAASAVIDVVDQFVQTHLVRRTRSMRVRGGTGFMVAMSPATRGTVVRVLREQAALEWCEMALRAALDERASLPPHEARGWI